MCAVGLKNEIENVWLVGENKTKFENILTHWSVAQAGSNEEKTRGRKCRWTVSLSSCGCTKINTLNQTLHNCGKFFKVFHLKFRIWGQVNKF